LELGVGGFVTSRTGPHVVVHAEFCAGSGACRRAAPTVFGSDGNGWVTLLDEHPTGKLDEVLDAQQSCPLGVIEVVDDGGEPLT